LIFAFVGRIEPYKGITDLLDAFCEVKTDSHLLIAGKASHADLKGNIAMRAGAHSNIHFYPEFIPEDQLQLFMNAADVIVLPYLHILTSGTLVLAMSFGKPVVVPDFPSLREIVPEEGALWFRPGDCASLAMAMERAFGINLKSASEANFMRASGWSWHDIAVATTAERMT
jgi:glycosyltransferase involved in cell wall biosynthesis